MAVPMKNGGMKISKVIFYVILSGITTGVGAFFGAIVGSISEQVIAICLSFAARSNVIYCIRRVNTRGQPFISWKNDSIRKYNRIFVRNFSNKDLGDVVLHWFRVWLGTINIIDKKHLLFENRYSKIQTEIWIKVKK